MRPAITLLPREPPLEAVAVAATGSARQGLATATLRRLRDGQALRAAAGKDWLVVLGAANDLPWVDGVRYLGQDGELLVPTTRRVDPSPDLVARAVGGTGELIVVLEDVLLRGRLPVRTADPDRLMEL